MPEMDRMTGMQTVTHQAESPPVGWYLAHEVGWLAGVSGDRIGQWARHGYIRSSRSEGRPRVYSFQDVAEAIVVHELLDRGVPQREIRSAIQNLREKYGDWPLTTADLVTADVDEGAAPFLGVREGREVLHANHARGDQPLLPYAHLQEIAALLRRGGWVVRDLDVKTIEVDPAKIGGTPSVRGRRIPAEQVARMAAEHDGWATLREGYDLSDAEIDDAVRWYAAVSELAPAA